MAGLIETEYLTQNGLIAYPFVDGSRGFAENFFLDAVIVLKHLGHGAYISRYFNNIASSQVELDLSVFDVANTTLYTENMVFPWSALTEKEFVSYNSANCFVKLVVGKSLETEKFQTSAGSVRIFTRSDNSFTPSVVIRASTLVTSITYANKKESNNVAEFVYSVMTDDDANIAEGANMDFQLNGKASRLDVVARAGTGLYNNCQESENAIKSINNVHPDKLGNFFFETDDCYISAPLTNGLSIDNICTPKCEPEHLSNFAHYLNRVKDGLLSVGQYATDLAEKISASIDNYYNVVLPSLTSPNYSIKMSKSVLSLHTYYSILISIINPTSEIIIYHTAVTTDAEFVGVSRVEFGNATVSDINVTDYTGNVNCGKKADIYFTIRIPIGEARSINIPVEGGFTAMTPISYNLS